MDKSSLKLEYIDSARGLAILGVMVTHISQYGTFLVPRWLEIPIENGLRGVQLFYVASAFTLILSFAKRQESEKNLIRNFFIRRFFRIAPIYYLGIIYYLWQDGFGPRYWLGDMPYISVWNVLANTFFMHGFNPYWITSVVPGGWSIAVEMSFYLVLPFLFLTISSLDKALIWFVCSIIGSSLLKILLVAHPLISSIPLWNEYLYLFFPSQFPVFIAGIVFYFMGRKETITITRTTIFCSTVLFVLFVVESLSGYGFYMQKHIQWSIGFIGLLWVMQHYSPFILVNALTKFIGKISFSLYIVHFGVLFALTNYNLLEYSANPIVNFSIRAMVMISIASIIAFFTFKTVELPFQRMGKKLITKLNI